LNGRNDHGHSRDTGRKEREREIKTFKNSTGNFLENPLEGVSVKSVSEKDHGPQGGGGRHKASQEKCGVRFQREGKKKVEGDTI